MTVFIGILLALGCALATNLGFLYKHRGACAAPAVDIRRPIRTARALYSSKWFTIGMLLAVMAERMFGFKVRPKQWIGLGLTAGGLVLLGITLPATHGAHSQFSVAGMIAFEAGLIGMGALLIA